MKRSWKNSKTHSPQVLTIAQLKVDDAKLDHGLQVHREIRRDGRRRLRSIQESTEFSGRRLQSPRGKPQLLRWVQGAGKSKKDLPNKKGNKGWRGIRERT